MIKTRSLGDQVRYYAEKIEELGGREGTEPNWEILGLSIAMRMTAKSIDDAESLWFSRAPVDYQPGDRVSRTHE